MIRAWAWRLLPLLLIAGMVGVWLQQRPPTSIATDEVSGYRLAGHAFVLPADGTLRFSWPSSAQALRLVLTPVAASGQRLCAQSPPYRLGYAALDAYGREQWVREWSFRSVLLPAQGALDQPYAKAGGLLEGQMVFASDSLILPTPASAAPQQLELRASLPPGISQLLVRVYAREPPQPSQRLRKWLQKLPIERERLALHAALGPEYLSTLEAKNLVANQWRPLGPLTLRNLDVQRASLLLSTRGPATTQCGLDSGNRSGWLAHPGLHATLKLPPGYTRLRIALTPLAALNQGLSAGIFWQGDPVWKQQHWQWSGLRAGQWRELEARAGLWAIVPTQLALVAVQGLRGGRWEDLRPPDPRQILFDGRVAPQWPVFSAPGAQTLYRIELRDLEDGVGRHHCRAEWLGADHTLRFSEALSGESLPDVYARPDGFPPPQAGAALIFVRPAPTAAAHLRVSCTTASAVAVRNRPADLALARSLPASADTDTLEAPIWFSLAPEDADGLRLRGAQRLLELRTRLANSSPLLSGDTLWEALQPVAAAVGDSLLLQREAGAPRHFATRRYRELQPGVSAEIQRAPADVRESLRVWGLRPGSGLREAELELDGQPLRRERVTPVQQWLLDGVTAGRHQLRLRDQDSARWFAEDASADAAWQEGFAWRLNPGEPLDFWFDKFADEPMTAGLRLLAADRKSLDLEIEWQDIRTRRYPAQIYTLPKRNYRLHHDPRSPALRLSGEGQTLWSTDRIALPIGDDLPPGRYRLRVRLSGGAGWVIADRVRVGVGASARLTKLRGDSSWLQED